MAGNDCDQSSLLIALLRASDIPARYVRGDVELKIEDLMNWTGGETPEAAVKIMQSNWIPTQVLYKFDAIEGVIFDHIWVEIFDGHVWRLADPSYKEYVYTEGTEITSEQKDALANLMEGTVTISEDEKSFSANQELIEFAMEEAARILEGSVNSGREILVNEKNNLPPLSCTWNYRGPEAGGRIC
jgi:transglutaminase-like putative cysteine protease